MTIDFLTTQDKADWEVLYQGYATFYKVPMNEEIMATVWSWIFDEKEAFFALIAKDETGKGIGLMHFREMASPLRGKKVGFLDDLFVLPEARGSGAVDALFKRLQEEAKLRGWPLVRWITADDNFRARAVYDRLAKRTMWITYQMDV
ncbi:MAG: GNAT family N-acetyltransferase [Trueperaceae bacterium]|nr:GNAT family N-acetyltransferase [Trueperaceae bacterium]